MRIAIQLLLDKCKINNNPSKQVANATIAMAYLAIFKLLFVLIYEAITDPNKSPKAKTLSFNA